MNCLKNWIPASAGMTIRAWIPASLDITVGVMRLTLTFTSLMLILIPAQAQEPVVLVDEGRSELSIVIEPAASASEKYAAEELQKYLEACTGIKPPVKNTVPDTPSIVLGCGPNAKQLGVDPKPEALGEQGYVMRTVAPHIVIAGTPAAGTFYGTLDFIEQYLGVRWYAPGVIKTPTVKSLALPRVDRRFEPAFAWRHTSYAWPGKDAEFLVHQRDNNGGGGEDHPYGLQYSFDGRCHSYFWYVSPGEFFDTHPEYFSEIGGVRRRKETQLCLTNPEVLDIVADRILKRMVDKPHCRQHNFSQQDYYNYCECDKCTAINEKYGTKGGTQFWFVNKLAERTSRVFPDKLIGTLAYTYTEEPPEGMKMHPNVAVWLCHMFPSCDSHPIATCSRDARYRRRALEWSEICSHLYVWHYIVDFAHYYNPFPNFRAMAADMKFYRDIGVEGVYLQAMGSSGGGGEFSLLRPYYGMKLLWNPDVDPDGIIRDFLEGYYGPAHKPVWEYITMLHDKVEQENIHMHLYTNPAQGYLTDAVLEKALDLFDRAEEAVKDDAELLERVRVARMPLTYARFFPRNGFTIENEKLQFKGPFASLEEIRGMYKRVKKHGFKTLREWQGDPEQLMLSAILRLPIPAPRIQDERLAVDLVPFLGGRALRIIHRESGKCVTAYDVRRYLGYPFQGGEETRTGGIFKPESFFVPYDVIEKTDTSITLEAKVGAFKLQRKVALSPDAPVVEIAATMINPTDKPRETNMRSHLELDLGPLRQTKLRFTNRKGEKVVRGMEPIIAGLREGEHYYDEQAPAGEWTFTGAKGLAVTQRFDDDAADFTWVYAYPEDLNDLEVEVWNKPVVIQPGESAVLKHTLEIRSLE